MINHREQFCARLKKARLEVKLKQAQVARYLQLPVSAVSAFESGQRKLDAIELFMLSRLYQKPLEWFFEDGRPSSSLSAPSKADPLLDECIRLLQKAPTEMRRSAAYGVIGFLSRQ